MFNNTVFKTAQSRDRIRTQYNEILSVFPVERKYVNTSFGRTFVLESGAPTSPALILLHGSCSNSAFWFGEICALSDRFHVLAVDIIGEAGNSDENRLDLNSDGYADWLCEVFDALSIDTAVVAGNSLGGFMALKFATKYPERVSKLVLIATAGLSGLNTGFLDKANTASANHETMTMDSSVTGGIALPKEVEEFINLILWGYNPIKEELPVFTDERLKRLHMPLLSIAGRNDGVIDTVSAAQRLRALLPQAEVLLLENTGHMVINAFEYMIPFLR